MSSFEKKKKKKKKTESWMDHSVVVLEGVTKFDSSSEELTGELVSGKEV